MHSSSLRGRPDFTRRAVRLALGLCVLAIPASSLSAKSSVPDLASICGVQVGVDFMGALEKRIGPGQPCLGGHSHSGRCWHAFAADGDIYADGFYYPDHSPHEVRDDWVIDEFSLTAGPPDYFAPSAEISRKRASFMGVVSLGMTKTETLRLLKDRLPPPKIDGSALVWAANGFHRINRTNDCVVRAWSAKLTFRDDKLEKIETECDPIDHDDIERKSARERGSAKE
jgi:hypothetical protein